MENANKYPILENGAVKEFEKKINELGKPSIFIGSTSERIPLANYIKSLFDPNKFNVDCWYDGIFGKTLSKNGDTSNIEWLKNFTDIYDFGIFLFTEDDYINNDRGLIGEGVRHNVVFEFGLFLGRLGASKSYIIKTDKTDMFINDFFTDLKENIGVYLNRGRNIALYIYEIPSTETTIERDKIPLVTNTTHTLNVIKEIQNSIIKSYSNPEISFLPATTLAIGYFDNLILIYLKSIIGIKNNNADILSANTHLLPYNLTGKKIELTIIIPERQEDLTDGAIANLFNNKIFAEFGFVSERMRPVKVLQSSINKNTIQLFDIPKTLTSTASAIKEINKNADIQELLWAKELRNFRAKLEERLLFSEYKKDFIQCEFSVKIISKKEFENIYSGEELK